MRKGIAHILPGREKQITREEKVLQPLPHKDFRFANPFIVLHHLGPEMIAAGSAFRIHPHPHRGFAPVTFMLQGEGYHKDNAGHNAIIKAGDVQWMFAGKGILHSEGPTRELLQHGGVQEFIQIWVNAPKAHKWDNPSYQSADIMQQPLVFDQEGVDIRLASGNYGDKTGPLKSFVPVITMTSGIRQGGRIQFAAIPGYWTLLYVIKGTVCVNQETIALHNLIVFEKENDEIIVSAEEDAQVLFLSAEPIEEPVAARDNFVMNTPEEITQAIADYQNGIFGSLNY